MWSDRHAAGVFLAQHLIQDKKQGDVVVGLARGGVLVASVVAVCLHIPLEVLVIKKIPSPGNPELALGAVAPDGVSVVDWDRARSLGADQTYVAKKIRELKRLVRQKTARYYHDRPAFSVRAKRVILVDDGVATGSTMEAAIRWCTHHKAREIIVSIPVIAADTLEKVRSMVSAVVSLEIAEDMGAVGEYYRDFVQVEDPDVIELLKESKIA